MEITFIGHSCFKIKGKELTLVIDPYDPKHTGYKLSKLKADLVLSTHSHKGHSNIAGVSDSQMVINTAGDYEKSDVYIEGLKTFHDSKNGEEHGTNLMYQIQIDGFTVLHVGDLGHELKKETLEQLIDVDVLLLPVGGGPIINAKTAAKVISSVEPKIVIPMHYQEKEKTDLTKDLDPVKKFLEEMGDENVKEDDKLKISRISDLPEEMEVVLLKPAH